MRFCIVWMVVVMSACGGGSASNSDAPTADASAVDVAVVEISPTFSNVSLSVSSAEVGVTTITATIVVKDRTGAPVANWPVRASSMEMADTLSPVARTNDEGKTEVAWRSTLAGARRLSLDLGDVTLNSDEVNWLAGVPAQLHFGALPTSWVAGTQAPGVEISLQDQFGNPATTGPRDFVLSLAGNGSTIPYQLRFSITGMSATINGIVITVPGVGYRFRVASFEDTIIGADSSEFDILAMPPTITPTFRTISDTTIVADDDQETEIAVRLVDGSFEGLPNYPVAITVSGNGNTIITTGLTSDRGTYRARVRSSVAEPKTITLIAGSFTQTYNVEFVAKPCTPRFESRETFNLSFNGRPFVAGDFNGDGVMDYAHVQRWYSADDWINRPYDSELVVRIGLGGGRFRTSPNTIPFLDRFGRMLSARDFNGDGRIDFLLSGNERFIVMLGAGDGTFSTRQESPLSSVTTVIHVGDFTGDGKADILGEGATGPIPFLAIFQGFGDGKFAIGRIVRPTATQATISPPAVADVDVDGKLDLVCVIDNLIVVLRGRGDGTFLPAQTRIEPFLQTVRVADFNRNGAPDLLVSGSGNQGPTRIALGNRNGTFGAFTPVGDFNLVDMRILDLNGDNTPDLVGQLTYVSRGDGTFLPPVELGVPSNGLANDWDNDGDLDLLGETLFENIGGGTFAAPKRLDTAVNVGTGELLACSGDYTGDGIADLVASDFAGISIFRMTSAATIATRVTTPVVNSTATFSFAADVNQDSKLDAIVSGSVYLGNGDGSLVLGPTSPQVGGRHTVKADFNGDGNVDLAWHGFDKIVRYALGMGDGRFGTPIEIRTAGDVQLEITGLSIADFNEDGAVDLVGVVFSLSNSTIVYWQNEGTALPTFATLATQLPAPGLSTVAGDFNGDGHVDVAALTSVTFCFLPGGGTAGFGVLKCANRVGGSSRALEAVDLDRNGTLDLVGQSDFGMIYYQGFGDGTFRPSRRFAGYQPLLFDYNQDQKLDLVWGRNRYEQAPPAFFISTQRPCVVE